MSQKYVSPIELMRFSPVIPVIEIEDVDSSIALAQALIDGGIRVLEITLRTSAALEVMQHLSEKVPEAVVGAGTVVSTEKLHKVMEAGAAFAISPGSTETLLHSAKEAGFPLLPGVANASEIMQGLALGYQEFKLFPAEVAGGLSALKAFAGPFAKAKFCPTGGINTDNFLDYLALPNVVCVGGSWVAPKVLVRAGKFEDITALAANAIQKSKERGYDKK